MQTDATRQNSTGQEDTNMDIDIKHNVNDSGTSKTYNQDQDIDVAF